MHLMDPSFLTLYRRGIARGLQAAKRERHWVTVLAAFSGIILILQFSLLGLFAVQETESLLRGKSDIQIEIHPAASDTDIGRFYATLQQQSYVEHASYITREQAYERARQEDAALTAFMETFNVANPFPDTISIVLKTLDDYDHLASFIQQSQWKNVVDPAFLPHFADQQRNTEDFLKMTRGGSVLMIAVLIITAFIVIFVTTELVRRRVLRREQEVSIERQVGAHPLTIIVPFATEATLLLWMAVSLSMFVLVLLLWLLPALLPAISGNSGLIGSILADILNGAKGVLPAFFIGEIVFAPLLAMAGAWLGTR